MARVYLWHPLLVHFTVGLLATSVGLHFAARLVRPAQWRERLYAAARIDLWIGALVTALTVGAGMIAFGAAPRHFDDPRYLMTVHSWFAYGTFALFAALAAVSAWMRDRPGAAQPSWPFLAGLLVALAALAVTGWLGGELVFSHALGVEVSGR